MYEGGFPVLATSLSGARYQASLGSQTHLIPFIQNVSANISRSLRC